MVQYLHFRILKFPLIYISAKHQTDIINADELFLELYSSHTYFIED